ncbi:hypothetical protein PYCCODRAFT_570784 [Trametes coccinea BRFM310]|uniref:Uncharacterized protein n=1 Tax=Trametes coccinea (strain BRFM310) TaxID=1353009 RepID=A0A1Y2IIV6_TRAC3|nr:hypothetical protein PYCCODRAFT_570784 [Trametes coccinea BRFM310]
MLPSRRYSSSSSTRSTDEYRRRPLARRSLGFATIVPPRWRCSSSKASTQNHPRHTAQAALSEEIAGNGVLCGGLAKVAHTLTAKVCIYAEACSTIVLEFA